MSTTNNAAADMSTVIETVKVDIAPTFFRKSAIKKTVEILSCDEYEFSKPESAMRHFKLLVRVDGRVWATTGLFFRDTGRASGGFVFRTWEHETRGLQTGSKRQRRDSARVVAIESAVSGYIKKTFGGAS